MQVKLIRLFIFSAGVLLIVTAMAKIISSFGGDRVLEAQEPLFIISYRNIFRIFGSLEMGVALFCLFSKHVILRTGLIAWMATSFLIYRISMPWVGYLKPCPCLGSLTSALHVSPQIADNIMRGALTYLIIGSYATLFSLWRQRKKTFKAS